MKSIIVELIGKAKSIGLFVKVVTCDMGSGNQSMWREFGIHWLILLKLVKIPLKNLAIALLKHKSITLSLNTVISFKLPSDYVEVDHIKGFIQVQEGKHLKFTPNLKIDDLANVSYFKKMNVGEAMHIFSYSERRLAISST